MNFTREPIIETIISPKEGYKLSIRSSKGENQEEVLVEALEIVSFGHALFYRSLEKPKCFLVPVSDYEVFEVKETRVVLKNANIERTIKIGGGRDAPPRPPREAPEQVQYADDEEGRTSEEAPMEQRQKRDRRRRHRRRSDDRQPMQQSEEGHDKAPADAAVDEGGGAKDETKVSSSMFTHLFPPPTTLISDTISRYKDTQHAEGTPVSEKVEQEKPQVSDEDTVPSESHGHPTNEET